MISSEYITNLNIRSNYTFLSSTIDLKQYLAFAKAHNISTLTLTDLNNTHGVYEFYELCKQNNIKPIIGLDCFWKDKDKIVELTILATNKNGYFKILKLSTLLKTEKEYLSTDDIRSYLLKTRDLIVILKPNQEDILTTHRWFNLLDLQKETQFYIGINHDNLKNLEYYETRLTNLIVPCWPVTTLKINDIETLTVLEAIKNNFLLKETDIPNQHNHFYHSKPLLQKVFGTKLCENMTQIIDYCDDLYIDPQPHNDLNIPQSAADSKEVLSSLCLKKLKVIFGEASISQNYLDRLNFELEIINNRNFTNYFLIVSDYVTYAKNNNIMVGPARGSVAGSLVAYLCNITTVDPLKYGLLFERFLNPERISLPDIDVDFQDNKREEIITYIKNKYGSQNVAYISTFINISLKMGLRDLGRVFSVPLSVINELCSYIKKDDHEFDNFLKAAPQIKVFMKKYPLLFTFLPKILHYPRKIGTHAAGIIINKNNLSELIPLQKGNNNCLQTQFSLKYLEKNGLIKFDILGIHTLKIIQDIKDLIEAEHQIAIDFERIPLNDLAVYRLIGSGKLKGIFQFETPIMTQALKKIKPENFNELTATMALIRPGAINYLEKYIKQKTHIPVSSVDVKVSDLALNETYGIILYQEQIMMILQQMANFTLGEADLIRRSIIKTDYSLINKFAQNFHEKAENRGHKKREITKVWNDIEQFSNYGFNKSHAVAYTLISYWLCYFKVNYPLFFITAMLNNNIGNQEKTIHYLLAAQKIGISILPPSIQQARTDFYCNEKNNAIVFGLSAINGITTIMAQEIVTERSANGFFKDFFEFVARMSFKGWTKEHIICLIKAGALSDIHQNRLSLLASLDQALKYASLTVVKDPTGKSKLNLNIIQKPKYTEVEVNDAISSIDEIETMGISISYRFQEKWKQKLDSKNETIALSKIEKHPFMNVKIIAMIKQIDFIQTKNHKNIIFIKVINDEEQKILTVFEKTFNKLENNLKIGQVLLMNVFVKKINDITSIILEDIEKIY